MSARRGFLAATCLLTPALKKGCSRSSQQCCSTQGREGCPGDPPQWRWLQLLSPLQEVWPSAVGWGGREAEEPLHPDAQRHPAARAGERPPLQHPHHCPVRSTPSSPPKPLGLGLHCWANPGAVTLLGCEGVALNIESAVRGRQEVPGVV